MHLVSPGLVDGRLAPDDQARQLEMFAAGPSLEAHVATERRRSADYGGRSVFGWEADPRKAASGD